MIKLFRYDSMAGKVVLIKGGGLGCEIAHVLSARQARVRICGWRYGLCHKTIIFRLTFYQLCPLFLL